MNNQIINNKLGFSILEVVVAILIITIGMIGVSSLVIQNIQAQYINKNILVASGLAQEGLELVRNIRDLNWLKEGNDPANDWKRDIVGDGTYAIDYRKICIGGNNWGTSCVVNNDCDSKNCRQGIDMSVNSINDSGARLYLDNTSNFYIYPSAGATATNFYRLITVDASHAEYLDVKCTIRWQEGNQNHDYTAETYLYNWR
jgi:type II secretory pathway pseudopilin PulG